MQVHSPRQAPDLVVTFSPGYRASWDSMLGGMAAYGARAQHRALEREHASADEATVPGVWLSTMPLAGESMSVMDVAPTVLQYFRRPVPPDTDGMSRLAPSGAWHDRLDFDAVPAYLGAAANRRNDTAELTAGERQHSSRR